MIGIVDCHRQECTKLAIYLSASEDPFSRIVFETEKPKKHGILAFLHPLKEGSTKMIDDEHESGLIDMKLHGDYFKQQNSIPNIDLHSSRRWLNTPNLRFETESILCAAQEQALATNHIQSKIWGTRKNSMCRLCKEQSETIHHIISGCKMLAGTQYMYRHNQVAKYIHWNILRDLKVKVSESWLHHKPEEVSTVSGIKVLWDSYILTDKKVPHNRPDIIIHNEKNQECLS